MASVAYQRLSLRRREGGHRDAIRFKALSRSLQIRGLCRGVAAKHSEALASLKAAAGAGARADRPSQFSSL